ncbi:MAG TPA: hypothetical protein VGH93_11585 [Solirubrobacteraceae bacterium]
MRARFIGSQLSDPAIDGIVGGESNAASLIVLGLVEPETGLGAWAICDRNDEDLIELGNVDSNDISTPVIRPLPETVIGAVCVEPDRALTHPPGLHLDAQETPMRRNDGGQIEREAASERHEDRNAGADQLVEHSRFRSVASLNRVHDSKLSAGPDEHMFVSHFPLAFAIPRP